MVLVQRAVSTRYTTGMGVCTEGSVTRYTTGMGVSTEGRSALDILQEWVLVQRGGQH